MASRKLCTETITIDFTSYNLLLLLATSGWFATLATLCYAIGRGL